VTYQCNSKCSHCNIWKRYKETPNDLEKELTLNQIEHLLYHSQYLANLKKVVLAGGEPFLRKDFVELCNLFTRRYPHAQITIPTNAVDPVLVASKLQEIKHAYDNKGVFLSVSLDGIGNKHDQFRGTPDNFENALQLLEYVRDSLATVGLGVSFTITPANSKELHDVYKLSKKMRADFNCQFAHKSQTYYSKTQTI
jgi:MoaA/NifB/PqqE/SkfB family radical SAM enzyme